MSGSQYDVKSSWQIKEWLNLGRSANHLNIMRKREGVKNNQREK